MHNQMVYFSVSYLFIFFPSHPIGLQATLCGFGDVRFWFLGPCPGLFFPCLYALCHSLVSSYVGFGLSSTMAMAQ